MKPCTKTVVTGVIGGDAHLVGNWIVQHALVKAGFNVVGIGVLASQENFIHAAVETKADSIWVSSLYGMGFLDCQGFRQKCMEAGLDRILLYIGGSLVVGLQDWREVEQKFKDIGFDRVYPPQTRPSTAIRDLKKDLGILDD